MNTAFAIGVGVVSALAVVALGLIRSGSSGGSAVLVVAGGLAAVAALIGIAILGRAVILGERQGRRP